MRMDYVDTCVASPASLPVHAANVMSPACVLARALLLFLVLRPVQGGICWSTMVRHGRCTELLDEKMTKEECCATNGVATAWSSDDLDAGTLFFWRVLGGGVPCHPCKDQDALFLVTRMISVRNGMYRLPRLTEVSALVWEWGLPQGRVLAAVGTPVRVSTLQSAVGPPPATSETCQDVQCGAGKKCMVRKGLPKCVCFPHCRGNKNTYRGPVCGTDGRTYRSVCKLRKRACRKNNASLAVAYHGVCQSSCDRIRCPAGKYCLLDQNLSPHCVRCSRRCSHNQHPRPVCGTDSRTYHSSCHIRQAACRRGKAIPIAYKGRCIPTATCHHIHCSLGQRCLTEWQTERPRCVTCSSMPCSDHHRRDVVVCGSNNRTYHSWCHMVKDSCATGYVIETQSPGHCSPEDQDGLLANTVL